VIYAKPPHRAIFISFQVHKNIQIQYSFHKVNPFSDNLLLVKFTYPIRRSGRFSVGIYMLIKFLTVPPAKIIFTGDHKYTKRDSIITYLEPITIFFVQMKMNIIKFRSCANAGTESEKYLHKSVSKNAPNILTKILLLLKRFAD
jgi:hypothetical protein